MWYFTVHCNLSTYTTFQSRTDATDSLHEGQMHFSASGGLTPGNNVRIWAKSVWIRFCIQKQETSLVFSTVFFYSVKGLKNWNTVLRIVADYGVEPRGIGFRWSSGARDVFLSQSLQDASDVHQLPFRLVSVVPSPGCEADRLPFQCRG